MSAGKRDQIEFFFKKKFLSKIDVDLIVWSRILITLKKNFLSIWSLFSTLTPYDHIKKAIEKTKNLNLKIKIIIKTEPK